MKIFYTILIALVMIAMTMTSQAQMVNQVNKKVLTLEGAKKIAATAALEAQKQHVGGSIAVVDEGGHLLYLERWDGTFPASAPVATAKARTAAIFRFETQVFENAIKKGRNSLTAVPMMLPLEGGIPIIVDGQVIGAVGVSGTASSTQDVEFAKAAIAALK